MKCQVCDTANSSEAKFCANCGAELPSDQDTRYEAQQQRSKSCTNCDHQNLLEARFCAKCGVDLTQHRRQAERGRHHRKNKQKQRQFNNQSWWLRSPFGVFAAGFVLVIGLLYIFGNPSSREKAPEPLIEQRSGDPAIEANVHNVASKFICGCGTCGEQPLDVCTCETAIRERQFIRSSLMEGRTTEEVIVSVNRSFGSIKDEFAAQYGSLQ